MSWEDELESERRPAAAQSNQDDYDPFSPDPPAPSTTFGSNRPTSSSNSRPNTAAAAADDLSFDQPLPSPPTVALRSAIGSSSRSSNTRARPAGVGLSETVTSHRREQQAIQAARQAAVEDEEAAVEEQSRKERLECEYRATSSASKPSIRRAPSTLASSASSLPLPPALSDLQQELLSVASLPEPPQRLMHIQPLDERLKRWTEEEMEQSSSFAAATRGAGKDAADEDLRQRLKVLFKQYVSSRPHSISDTRRIWNTSRTLHTLSVKLASVHSIRDLELLEEQLSTDLHGVDPASNGFTPADSYFYDLHSLDLDSYNDIRHAHSSSIQEMIPSAAKGKEGEQSAGWWRTQLAELEEDISDKRRQDAARLKEIEEQEDELGHLAGEEDKENQNPLTSPAHKAYDHLLHPKSDPPSTDPNEPSLLLARRDRVHTEPELESDLLRLSGGHAAQPMRLTREQRLAREQGRAYHSVTSNRDILLPEGQRILSPGLRPSKETKSQGAWKVPSAVVRDIEEAFKEGAPGVKQPQRKSVHM